MTIQVSAIMLGVQDVDRAKSFYVDGLGATIQQDYPGFVRCGLGDGSSDLALYAREAAAADAGVSAEGSGFSGVSFHYLTDSRGEVDTVLRTAVDAGATEVKPASAAEWGGYFGYFSAPDGHLLKVATDS